MNNSEGLRFAIAALQAQRALLGDAVVDAALGPMREQLARLASPAAEAPAEQALKQVSVLFLDVVGSTAMSQRLDPEQIHAVMDGALVRCSDVVVAHGGTVLQYAGDSLLAAFGAKGAQEDDAERAVRCGLALLDEGRALAARVLHEHGWDGCDFRVGIHTGGVLLGGGVNDAGTIRGLTVNIAARMEQNAPAGRLRISHDTWLLVRGLFDVEPQAAIQVKGRDTPILTYLVRGANPHAFRAPSRGIEGVTVPMIGRGASLARLEAMLGVATGEQTLQAVTLIGEPGIGKSRLLHELRSALDIRRANLKIFLARAHPQSRLQPYGLLRTLLCWEFGIVDSDVSVVVRDKLFAGLAPTLGADGAAQARAIGEIVGLSFAESSPAAAETDPRHLRAVAFSALHAFFRASVPAGGACAMLLEDLHWADDDSLDFIAELLQMSPGQAQLIVATARPELLERRPQWVGVTGAHRAEVLEPLEPEHADRLAASLLQRLAGDAEPVRRLLIERSEGNPLHMEELVRMLVDDGMLAGVDGHWVVDAGRMRADGVPTTLVGVLQARIDALPTADRKALQAASIIGDVFWDDALASIEPGGPASLPRLIGRSLVRRHPRSVFEDTPEEAFHHHLQQQVAYDTVLKPARQAGHAAAAQWLSRRVGDRSAEYLAITAQHYQRAGDHARAFEYFERAAFDASQRYANRAAFDHAARALASPAATDLRQRYRLLDLQVKTADLLGDRALQQKALDESAQIAEALDDDELRAAVMFARCLLASRRGDETLSYRLAEELAELGARTGNPDARAHALADMAWSLHSAGNGSAARERAQAALASAREARQREDTEVRRIFEVQVLTLLAIIERACGDRRAAEAVALQALESTRELRSPRPQASILQMLGVLAMDVGRYPLALERLAASRRIAAEVGWTVSSASSQFNIARTYRALGQHDRAIEQATAAEADARRCESVQVIAECLLVRGTVLAATGNSEAAARCYDEARETFAKCGDAGSIVQVFARTAELHARAERWPQALALTEQVASELAGGVSLSATDEPLFPHLLCHRIWAERGDPRAGAAIEAAHGQLQAMAARAGDAAAQRGMLDDVPLHREIVAAWEAARGARLADAAEQPEA